MKSIIAGGENVPLAIMMRDIWCSRSYSITERTLASTALQEKSSLTMVLVALVEIVGIISSWEIENGPVASLNAG